jgi:hypothetical protein
VLDFAHGNLKFGPTATFRDISLDTLTETCKQSINDLLNSPDAACLNPGALLSFFVGNQQSVPATVDNWLTGLCAAGACPDETIASVITNVTTGCSEDLASFGVSTDIAQQIIPIAQQVYPTARKVVCLKECVTPFRLRFCNSMNLTVVPVCD